MKLIVLANARIPSEKAHPYQIVQMCEAFASTGAEVRLIYPYRKNAPDIETADIWSHYGVAQNFEAVRLNCTDLYPLAQRLPRRLGLLWEKLAALVLQSIYQVRAMRQLAREPEAVIYSRNAVTLFWIALLRPRWARRAFYEGHKFPASTAARRLRCWLIERVGGVIVVTGHLRDRTLELGIAPERIAVAHDGIRAERFAIEGDQDAWREKFGWPREAFIAGYVGRFHTLGMDKGLTDLAEAVIALAGDKSDRPVRLGLVGGPDSYVGQVRQRIEAAGLPQSTVLYAGQVPPADVPGYLRAFDVCAMPFPWTEHFAYYASPMKLFEYMASGSALLATDLPSTAEIVRDGENGLLVPPSDIEALADALRRLRDDPALAARIAAQAAEDVKHYTWEARAKQIFAFIDSHLAG
ncbi:MAG: glycosyltransferase family 4 protein [Anaerolineae bacterium]|nr:glycosyltransferase family 4 protein [Anaerolineae bacterium]